MCRIKMTTAKRVREYLTNKPYVLEALEKDIVSINRLAGIIRKDSKFKEDSHGAVKAALRRFAEKLRKKMKRREARVLRVLRGSSILLKDGVRAVISGKPLAVNADYMSLHVKPYGTNVYVGDKLGRISRKDILDVHNNCGVFVIISPPKVEKTPGVVAYLTSVLAEQNINLIEFVSCYTTTILVVNKEDISRTYKALSPIVGEQ